MKIRRPFRALVYVAVIAGSLAYIVFSASRLPAFEKGSIVGTATAGLFGNARSTGLHFHGPYVTKTTGAWSPIQERDLSNADLSDPAQGVVSVHRAFWPSRWGLWHPIVEKRHDSVRFLTLATWQPFTDKTERKRILEAINSSEWGPFVGADKLDFYASGGGNFRRILWLGVLGDLSILAAFAAIIFSLVKLRREIRWRKPGCCAECDYDLTGLRTDKCPECGAHQS